VLWIISYHDKLDHWIYVSFVVERNVKYRRIEVGKYSVVLYYANEVHEEEDAQEMENEDSN
jgi:hypothetical protein